MDRKSVWRFSRYDIDTDDVPVSERYATLDCIERIIKAEPVAGSARSLDATLVDERGFYIGPRLT